jgi:hypothetical protein
MREMRFLVFCATAKLFCELSKGKRILNISRVLSFMLAGSALAWACGGSQARQYEIDQPSPDGSFRVKVMVQRGDPGKTLDEAKFQFLERNEIIYAWDWKQEDRYGPDFEGFLPIKWVDENVLQIGGRGPKEIPFSDELTVTNASGQHLKYLEISYQQSNIYMVFDLPPGGQVKLSATPWTTVRGGEFSFGYGGVTQAGKRFTSGMKLGERLYLDGPRKIAITISPEQIQ